MPRRQRHQRENTLTDAELLKLRKRLSFMITNRRDHFIFTQLVWFTFFTGQAPVWDVAVAADKVRADGKYSHRDIVDMDLFPLQDYLRALGCLHWRNRPFRASPLRREPAPARTNPHCGKALSAP